MLNRFVEKAIHRRCLHRGATVSFWSDRVRLPGGRSAIREYMGHPGAAAIIPLFDSSVSNPRILMVQQYRYVVGELTCEIPAGKLDSEESAVSCARRELEEETGYRARRVKKLISFWPTPAFNNEIIHIYTAEGLYKGKFNPDDDELIQPEIMTLKQITRKIESGDIKDSKTIIGIYALRHSRLKV